MSIIPGLGLLLMICNWTSSQMDHRKYTRRGRIIFLHINRTLTLKLVSCPTEYSSSVYNTVSICSHFVISFYIGLPACSWHKISLLVKQPMRLFFPEMHFCPNKLQLYTTDHSWLFMISLSTLGQKKCLPLTWDGRREPVLIVGKTTLRGFFYSFTPL